MAFKIKLEQIHCTIQRFFVINIFIVFKLVECKSYVQTMFRLMPKSCLEFKINK